MKQLDKIYEPSKVESRIYEMWEKGGYFRPEVNPDGEAYTIMMPPPNITGQLHIGHAFTMTMQDILTRYQRMCGKAALWLPGEDHASIATEVKVLEKIRKDEGLTKQDLGREAFLERAQEWSTFYRNRIATQLRRLGSSCDWSRERFTMDEGCSNAVKEAFMRLYDKGLIYRANRIINWCPNCKTALSDAEVEYEEAPGHLWRLKYPIKGRDGEYMIVATTRPETMLGDSGVAVHPEDERYSHLVGATVMLPLMDREIPIIADEYVEMDFGTGCVKMTPSHDPNDFEVGLRHRLEQIRVMNDDATINELGGKYCGMDRYEARKAIVADLDAMGLLDGIEDINHNVGKCYRCSTDIEPITSLQWFVKMDVLAEPAINVVKDSTTAFVPDRFKKIYFNWMENIKDWCISRQLWWGHQIPAYYCDDCGEMIVAKDMPETCPKCGGKMHQDEDVLDTWFSSALWPFSTLGWPEKTPDLEKFYPNDVLVTGFDIIFFWVARMIFSGIEYMGETPFHHVYMHGLVRDHLGRKMSKSLGNGIDPLEVIDEYGADALRYALITGNSAGNDTRFRDEKVQASRNFANKINNAARFLMMNLEDFDPKKELDPSTLTNIDKWIISRTNEVAGQITANLDKYELGIALEKAYNFIWTEFCDWYIEFVKTRLNGDDPVARFAAQHTLFNTFNDILKMLHPFMPFITEEIYSSMNEGEDPLIIARWPFYDESKNFPKEQNEVSEIIEGIRAIRNVRATMNIPPSKKATLYISPKEGCSDIYEGNEEIFMKLASAEEVIIGENDIENALSVVTNTTSYKMPLDELIDKQKELDRLENERKKTQDEIDRLNKKLSNENFVAKAKPEVVAGEREKLAKYEALMADIIANIEKMK